MNSISWRNRKGCFSKVVKFDHFKIRVVDYFPSSKKFNRVTIPNPIFDYICRSAVILFGRSHICKRNIVLFVPLQGCYLRILDGNLCYGINLLEFYSKGNY